jgi:cytochrome b
MNRYKTCGLRRDFPMQVMRRLRLYHAILAILVVVAFVTGDDNIFHAWLGYAIAAIILLRLAWALTGVPQLGLMRFYPHFEGLRLTTAMTHPAISRTLLLAIATCLIAVTLTGIAMDRGAAVGVADQAISGSAPADNARSAGREAHGEDEDESLVGEAHEVLANLLMLLILTHVTYLLLFKRPLALFMLFFHTPAKRDAAP